MRRLIPIIIGFGFAMLGCANDVGAIGSAEEGCEEYPPPPPPEVTLCRVTGGGQILADDNPDSFGGNARPSFNSGHWNHVTHEGDHLSGVPDPESIVCFNTGENDAPPPAAPANTIEFSGTARWDHRNDCEFFVHIEDHGEPGTDDVYEITVTCGGVEVYSAGDTLLHGNLQIHEVPPGQLPEAM